MTKEQYASVSTAQIEIQQMASVLQLLAHAVDDPRITDALYACEMMARDIATRIDSCPGFTEAQRRA